MAAATAAVSACGFVAELQPERLKIAAIDRYTSILFILVSFRYIPSDIKGMSITPRTNAVPTTFIDWQLPTVQRKVLDLLSLYISDLRPVIFESILSNYHLDSPI